MKVESGVVRQSAIAALSAPLSLLVLAYGAFALFSLSRHWFGIELAPALAHLAEFYRASVWAMSELTVGLLGITLSEVQQDIAVVWLACGRLVSRSYGLLNSETVRSAAFEYPPFTRHPFKLLTRLNRFVGRASRGRAYKAGVAFSSLLITILWPPFLWVFVSKPTVQVRRSWREPIPGTPHPAARGQLELPPVGDEFKPKFSEEKSSTQPHYHAIVVMLAYAAFQLVAVAVLFASNSMLAQHVDLDRPVEATESSRTVTLTPKI